MWNTSGSKIISFDGMVPFPFFQLVAIFWNSDQSDQRPAPPSLPSLIFQNFLEFFRFFLDFFGTLTRVISGQLLPPSFSDQEQHPFLNSSSMQYNTKFILRLFSDKGTEAPFLNSWSSITLEQKQQVIREQVSVNKSREIATKPLPEILRICFPSFPIHAFRIPTDFEELEHSRNLRVLSAKQRTTKRYPSFVSFPKTGFPQPKGVHQHQFVGSFILHLVVGSWWDEVQNWWDQTCLILHTACHSTPIAMLAYTHCKSTIHMIFYS